MRLLGIRLPYHRAGRGSLEPLRYEHVSASYIRHITAKFCRIRRSQRQRRRQIATLKMQTMPAEGATVQGRGRGTGSYLKTRFAASVCGLEWSVSNRYIRISQAALRPRTLEKSQREEPQKQNSVFVPIELRMR